MTATEREPLTERQAEFLSCIAKHIAREGSLPSLREIRDEMGFSRASSPNACLCHIWTLVRKGYVRYVSLDPRGSKKTKTAAARSLCPVELVDAIRGAARAWLSETLPNLEVK